MCGLIGETFDLSDNFIFLITSFYVLKLMSLRNHAEWVLSRP